MVIRESKSVGQALPDKNFSRHSGGKWGGDLVEEFISLGVEEKFLLDRKPNLRLFKPVIPHPVIARAISSKQSST